VKTMQPLFLSLVCLTFTSACALRQSAAELAAPDLTGLPAWAEGDCRAAFGGRPVVCGVGVVSGVGSPSLARNAAMGRGRTEIARYL
jgi:hypothetical protein